MVLRVLTQILEVPKLGKTPRAHWGPIWPNFGPTKLILVTLRNSYEYVGGDIWELFGKNFEGTA